jgi:hypothetical protein
LRHNGDHRFAGIFAQADQGEIASLSGAGDDPRYFQINVPVQPSNSGGPLVDERGKSLPNMPIGLTQSCARRHPSRWHDIPKYGCEIMVDSCIFSTTLK